LIGLVASASSLSTALALVVGLAAAASLVTVQIMVAGGNQGRDSHPRQGIS